MSRGYSTYLDLLRLMAALLVFVAHASAERLSGGFLYQLQPFAHSAVMVFFVLSGFVIAFVTDTRETTLKSYAASRLARLYSVVIPAVVLTVIADRIGILNDPGIYYLDRETFQIARICAGFLFLTQSWNLQVDLLSNGPFWSLPYEFWYYCMFGAAMLLPGRFRVIGLVICSLAAGPKIIMLLPIWLFGVATYRLSNRIWTGRMAGALLFTSVAIIAAAIYLRISGLIVIHREDTYPNGFSMADYLLGIGIALNLLATTQFSFSFGRIAGFIKSGADMSFTLYLFHTPLLFCFATFLPKTLSPYIRGPILLTSVLSLAWVFSFGTEALRVKLKQWMLRAFGTEGSEYQSLQTGRVA